MVLPRSRRSIEILFGPEAEAPFQPTAPANIS